MKFSKSGFSLIELLIVIAISALILTLTISTFSSFSTLQSLDKDAEVVAGYIQKARNQTVNSKNGNEFGIRIATTTVTLFEGTTYSAGASTNVTHTLSSKVTLMSNTLKADTVPVTVFYFQQLTGEPSATGTITYRLISSASSTRAITIYGSGLIETQ